MQLIGRVILLALCVFSAYSLPSTINIVNDKSLAESVLTKIEDMLYNHFDSSNQTNSNNTNSNNTSNSTVTANSCFANYTIQQNILNEKAVNLTQQCYRLNNQSLVVNNQTVNSTVNEVNATSYELQSRLADCSARNSSNDIFSCYVFSFDRNLQDLSNITKLSILALDTLSGNYTNLEIAQRACVSSVITASKTDAILALNELESCVNRVENESHLRQQAVALE